MVNLTGLVSISLPKTTTCNELKLGIDELVKLIW